MSRLPYLSTDDLPAEFQSVLAYRPPLNLYRVLTHAPTVALPMLAMGGALRREADLDVRLREFAILRVGSLNRSPYEMHQHKRVARKAGMSDAEIAAATREGGEEGLTDFERTLLKFTDAVVLEVKAPQVLYDAVASVLSPRELTELLLTIGYYMMVCRFLENVEVDIESPPIEG